VPVKGLYLSVGHVRSRNFARPFVFSLSVGTLYSYRT
jgi:hypothetical protein